MKKLFTLLLVFTGMVCTASADTWTLRGFGNWSANAGTFTDGQATVTLAAETSYEFKVVLNDATWYGAKIDDKAVTISADYSNLAISTSGENITIKTGAAGIYTFTLSDGKLSVTYPGYTWKLEGNKSGDSWGTLATFSSGTASVSMDESSMYVFKILRNNCDYFGNNGTMTYINSSAWDFTSGGNNCNIKTTDAGTYTFTLNTSGSNPAVTVTYPDYATCTVYLYDNLSWGSHYAYPLTFEKWADGDAGGTGSAGSVNGIAMTQVVGSSNVYKAEYRYAGSTYIAFVEAAQNDFDKFYNNKAIYRGDLTKASRIYVPSTTSSASTNGTTYYSNGEWHPFPTYTRDVTEGNYGTICLPFGATVTGATIYQIVSTVVENENLTGINIQPVVGNTIEAGKAYIFKATGSTLTATMSGNYAAATEANGMLGNIGSTENVPVGNYVVGGDNKIHKVVAGGEGDHVTVGQYKGYITLDGINPAAPGLDIIPFFDSELSGINTVQASETKVNGYFNLNGQRVAQPTKGLYIVNGKKVVLK